MLRSIGASLKKNVKISNKTNYCTCLVFGSRFQSAYIQIENPSHMLFSPSNTVMYFLLFTMAGQNQMKKISVSSSFHARPPWCCSTGNQIKPSLKEDPAHENHDDRPQIHSHATCAGILRSINLQDIEYIIIYILYSYYL